LVFFHSSDDQFISGRFLPFSNLKFAIPNEQLLESFNLIVIDGLITFYNKYSKKYPNIDKGRHNNFIYML